MANIFPRQKLKQLASKTPTSEIIEKVEIIKRWLEDYEKGTLKSDKETSREQAYNQDFFIQILGYDEKPSSPYSFEPKPSTSQGELPDAIVGHLTQSAFTFADQKVSAVIELKGAAVGLDKPQKREGNMSPVQQGFKYKPKYKYCPFVIVSNFYEFRLYQDNQLDYEVWTLHDLCSEEDDYINFKTFYLLLKKSNFVPSNGEGKSATEELLTDIRTEQEEIGKDFYKVYKEARLELLRSMWRNNDRVKTDIDFGIEKAQKIIDRVVFACFAEDRGLLPDDTLRRLIKNSDESFGSLWASLRGFFEAIDKGSEKLEIPVGYNGGLFAEDSELNSLIVEDKPLRALAELSTYDFAEQLSVQILGHIFEQSITDLEDIKEKAESYVRGENSETEDKKKTKSISKRKKDGIFYTPDYIVKYIIDNSLGEYLRKAEDNFRTEAGLNADIIDKTYFQREKKAYGRYQDFLKGVKVCDPACGSGAFLVEVFDYLLQENKRVAEILDSLFNQDEFITDILHNNIYGVDINEESVEISKLSLWLKSAKKGKPLTSLSDNIKCGNSLIADKNVAGESAFTWENEFPEIFENGGFDVVVGNPPYGETIKDGKNYFKENYSVNQGKFEIFKFFIEKSIHILRNGGTVSFIAPTAWLSLGRFSKTREFVRANSTIYEITETLEDVFSDATVETSIFSLGKIKTDSNTINVRESNLIGRYQIEIPESGILLPKRPNEIVLKINQVPTKLGQVCEVWQGLIAYHSKDQPREYSSDKRLNETYKKLLYGGDISQYSIHWSGEYLSYGKWLHRPRPERIFASPKILVQRIRNPKLKTRLVCALDREGFVNGAGLSNVLITDTNVDLSFVLGILNSKLINFWFAFNFSDVNIKPEQIREIPITLGNAQIETKISKVVNTLIEVESSKQKLSQHVGKIVLQTLGLETLPASFDKVCILDFVEFCKKFKVKMTISQKNDLLFLHEEYQPQFSEMQFNIDTSRNEIDSLVYELYQLNEGEISKIEEYYE